MKVWPVRQVADFAPFAVGQPAGRAVLGLN
jgi:hypothetical protein